MSLSTLLTQGVGLEAGKLQGADTRWHSLHHIVHRARARLSQYSWPLSRGEWLSQAIQEKEVHVVCMQSPNMQSGARCDAQARAHGLALRPRQDYEHAAAPAARRSASRDSAPGLGTLAGCQGPAHCERSQFTVARFVRASVADGSMMSMRPARPGAKGNLRQRAAGPLLGALTKPPARSRGRTQGPAMGAPPARPVTGLPGLQWQAGA